MINFLVSNSHGFEYLDDWQKNCWINVECPTNEEIDFLVNRFEVPIGFLNDTEDAEERPRIEYEDEWYFIILRIPIKILGENAPAYSTVPLGAIWKEDVFISITHFKNDMVDDFVDFANRKKIYVPNYMDLFIRIFLSSSVWFQKYLKQVNQQIRNVEQELEKSIQNTELQSLLKIEKSLVLFTTSLKGNDILLTKLKINRHLRNQFDEELFEDAEIELKQAEETTKIYSDILSGMMDAYASVISNNLNAIMKRLTTISIILMIPTLIASLYGMNVPNFMEKSNFAFLGIITFSFLVAYFGYKIFKKNNWF
jgi:magnesium transporter